MVIFGAQVEITHNNRNLGACEYEDHKHEKQEPEYIVELVHPDRCEDEEEFDEDSTEWDNTSEEH